MKRISVALVALAWINTTDPTCGPHQLLAKDIYINGPGTGIGAYEPGFRLFPSGQTTWNLAPGKPVLDCAIAWEWPVAVEVSAACQAEPNYQNCTPMPVECQPTPESVDGQPLWGEE